MSGRLGEALAELRAFHTTPAPESPAEFRSAARLVKGLTYLSLALAIAAPVGIAYGYATSNMLLLLACLGVIPTFLLLAYAYPAFVAGERWSLAGIGLVGLGFLSLTPARFFTEAASVGGVPAIPPTRVEWIVFLASAAFLYIILSPETRAGMERARSRANAHRASDGPAPLLAPVPAAPAAPRSAGLHAYACPRCGRSYALKTLPPKGSLCPSCRRATAQ